CQQYDGLPHNF
nr:immunoglobulin light chain junction region [Macaca mulatta]